MRCISILLVSCALGSVPCASQAPRLELTYLANMGVLLESGGKRIIIDGLHHAEVEGTPVVPPSLLVPLEQSRDPFRRLDLVLATHRHLDHFSAASVAARMQSDSTVVFVAARETVDSLFARTALRPNDARIASRVRAVVPPDHGEVRLHVAGIDLTVLDLPHNPTRSRRVANVAFLLNLSGLRVLHVGDGDPTSTNFDPHHLAARPVDVAIVPFWYLSEGGTALTRSIGARTWIATHMPATNTASLVRKIREVMRGAIVLTSPGERHVLR